MIIRGLVAHTKLMNMRGKCIFQKNINSGDLKFLDITSIDDMWSWLQHSFVDAVVPSNHWYNGDIVEETGYSQLYNKQ